MSQRTLLLVAVGALGLVTSLALVWPLKHSRNVYLILQATPNNALFRMNGQLVGSSPLMLPAQPGQTLQIQAEAPLHEPLTRTVLVGEEFSQVVSMDLERLPEPLALMNDSAAPAVHASLETGAGIPSSPQPIIGQKRGTVRFSVRPWVEVVCGGRRLGATPLPDVELVAGIYECRFTHPELGELTQRIEVKPNMRTIAVVNF